MKGISTVVATILMLMITIALAGTAYMYITGVFTSKTGVVLSISSATCSISGSSYSASVLVRNDGTLNASSVSVTAPGFAPVASQLITSGSGNTFTLINNSAITSGYVAVTATAAGVAPASGSMFCT
jgi:flagellin-like protein